MTFLLKLAFYPLSEASGRSMAKMKQLQPRIRNLQETGPKLQRQLKATGPELARVTDYGYLYVLAQPLFIVLDTVDSIFHNWGRKAREPALIEPHLAPA